MLEEEKKILLNDLCARLSHHPILQFDEKVFQEDECLYGLRENSGNFLINDGYYIEEVKPYLRSMSTMTDDEKKYIHENFDYSISFGVECFNKTPEYYDYLNANHFDYRGLIVMGLALEAPEEMYKKGDLK